MLTLDEMCAILIQQYDVWELLEILDISTEELLERFDDKVEAKMDDLMEELTDEFTRPSE